MKVTSSSVKERKEILEELKECVKGKGAFICRLLCPTEEILNVFSDKNTVKASIAHKSLEALMLLKESLLLTNTTFLRSKLQ